VSDPLSGPADAVPELTLGQLDADGALEEALAGLVGTTRAGFLKTAALGGTALLAGLALPEDAPAAITDFDILNFDLTFEHLQSTFYTEAERVGTVRRMSAEAALWARTLGAHERAHVAILKKVLGSHAVKKPFFDFGGATDSVDSFIRTAVAMEDLTVGLLSGQAGRLRSRAIAAAVFSLLTVEARHAAWARRIRGVTPVARAFDRPRTLAHVRRVVASTGFIRRRPRTTSRRRPRFTG
jgi:rubrerythrin